MQDLLVKFLFFARPLMGISVNKSVLGLGYFEFVTAIYTVILLFILSINAIKKDSVPVPVTGLDIVIVVFSIYCVILFLGFFEVSSFARLFKLILPPLTFVLLKRAISDRAAHTRVIWLMLMTFSIPIIASTILISQGLSQQKLVYWTDFRRYGGVYGGPHELAHSAAFFVMCFFVYLAIRSNGVDGVHNPLDGNRKPSGFIKVFGGVLGIFAVYCIYWAQVRTAMVGLFVFLVIYLWFLNKKMLVMFLAVAVVVAIFFQDKLFIVFYDFMSKEDLAQLELDPERIGSGRFYGTEQRVNLFLNFPLAEQLVGIGIGNFRGFREPDGPGEMLLSDAHNDWMQVLLELGLIGFILVVTMYGFVLRAILQIPTRERDAFFALWIAVVAMNLGSNSYITRVPIGQMFFMLILYIQLPIHDHLNRPGEWGRQNRGRRMETKGER